MQEGASPHPPNISNEPYFVEETIQGHARGAVRVYPIRLIPPLIAFPFASHVSGGQGSEEGAQGMDEIHLGDPLVIGEATNTPLERVERYGVSNGKGCLVLATAPPLWTLPLEP